MANTGIKSPERNLAPEQSKLQSFAQALRMGQQIVGAFVNASGLMQGEAQAKPFEAPKQFEGPKFTNLDLSFEGYKAPQSWVDRANNPSVFDPMSFRTPRNSTINKGFY